MKVRITSPEGKLRGEFTVERMQDKTLWFAELSAEKTHFCSAAWSFSHVGFSRSKITSISGKKSLDGCIADREDSKSRVWLRSG
jgi:hypothetical protein